MRGRKRDEGAAPLDGIDTVLVDLDGVVYTGGDAVPFAVDALNDAARVTRVGYITNNASRTDRAVADQLRSFGLDVRPEDVVTSPQAAVRLVAGLVPAGSRVLAIGGEGLRVEIEKGGFVVVDSADDSPAAVIQGFSPDLGWKDLAEAAFALGAPPPGDDPSAEMPWIATNTDWTIPVARGIAPGNGTLVAAVHTTVGRLPLVAGKPEKAIFTEAIARFDARAPLFIGDRLDTDILGAHRAGLPSVHVLTGVDRAKQLLAAPEGSRPTWILDDLRGLAQPYPETRISARAVDVGSASVSIDGATVIVRKRGDHRIDLLRAACAAIWSSDRTIHQLDVPSELYS